MTDARYLIATLLAACAGSCVAAPHLRIDALAGTNVQSDAGAVPAAQLAFSWELRGPWSVEGWIGRSRSEALENSDREREPRFRAWRSSGLGMRYQFHRNDARLQPYLRAGWARSQSYTDNDARVVTDCSSGVVCVSTLSRARYRLDGDTAYFALGTHWAWTELVDLSAEVLYLPTARYGVVPEQVQLLLGLSYHF